jgi:hypothetical protein
MKWPALVLASGCMVGEPPTTTVEPPPVEVAPQVACPSSYDARFVYNAFATPGAHPSGAVATYAWQDAVTAYPVGGVEDFTAYGPTLPTVVECSDDKSARRHLDVTDGCLTAVADAKTNVAGQINAATDGAFRAVALAYPTGDPDLDVKWTDAAVEYRFFYTKQVGDQNNPGFKAFVRYRTEDDLYVASWRTDGVVQIQKKQCGDYVALAVLPAFGAPTPGVWHTIHFSATGPQLDLVLDGQDVLSATSPVFSWGTAGIRIDAMDGALIDDWKIGPP